ncbi:hypothetical protein GE061_000492 [Apolygus lucorum]|uniref:non-specific serine/threonine protein kinase n=1 Tax=Apolygus lucorum TaxID=248454 RepID=A0A8S9Y4R6_APOLU|nr:hypothetical protein GE061_000492 [Apolygus lucorum]
MVQAYPGKENGSKACSGRSKEVVPSQKFNPMQQKISNGKRSKVDFCSESQRKTKEALKKNDTESKRRRESRVTLPSIEWPINDLGYEIYDIIGRGGNAIVNLARCISNNKLCAIKRVILHSRRLGSVIDEVHTMSSVHHANLASFHTSFIYETELWIVFDYYHFGSLEDIMQRNVGDTNVPELFSERMIASVIGDVIRGLVYLHHYAFVHLDIKPGNILLREDGNAVLADFGSARNINDQSPGIVTTLAFRAPELVSSTSVTCRADIWSIGMTAVNLSGESINNMMKSPTELLELYREFARYSELFRWVTTSCLLLNPLQRNTAWLLLDHEFFEKPMKKKKIVKLVSMLPERKHTWKREQPPYTCYSDARRFGRVKFLMKHYYQEIEETTKGWLMDTPPSISAPFPTICNDEGENEWDNIGEESDTQRIDQETNHEEED